MPFAAITMPPRQASPSMRNVSLQWGRVSEVKLSKDSCSPLGVHAWLDTFNDKQHFVGRRWLLEDVQDTGIHTFLVIESSSVGIVELL